MNSCPEISKRVRKTVPLPLSDYEFGQAELQPSNSSGIEREVKLPMRSNPMSINPPLTNDESLPIDAGMQSMANTTRKLSVCLDDAASILHSFPIPEYAPRNTAKSNIFRRVAKPAFPVRVNQSCPIELPWHTQERIMKWRYKWDHFGPSPVWLVEPDINQIKVVVQPYLERLGHKCSTISVRFLDEGSFNKIYTIKVEDVDQINSEEYIFRITLPVAPYFKTESDVATTEIVRHFTQIPVPTIYAFDSSMNNQLELEWILMEKIRGRPLYDNWSQLSNHQQMHIVNTTAIWTKQLAQIQADKIGAIYMRSVEDDLVFYVGRSLDLLLIQDTRRLFEIERGPFATAKEYYNAVLCAVGKEVDTLIDKSMNVAQDADASSSRSDLTKLSQGSTKVGIEEDEISRKGREIDEENAEWREFSLRHLDILQNAILLLKSALPELCERASETSDPLVTYLTHQDMSLSNIMVDELYNPVALLDWELMQLEPIYFLSPWPRYLSSGDRSRPPSLSLTSAGESSSSNEGGDVALQSQEQDRFREDMHEYISTKLRPQFLEELRRVDSPLAAAAPRDDDPFQEDLHFRITELHENYWDHAQWVKDLTGIELEFDEDKIESEEKSDGENSETSTS